jgi:hypothetical protein
MRWWSEFRYPALKCARLGHRIQVRKRRGYCLPHVAGDRNRFGNIVAYNVDAECHICTRCGFEDEAFRVLKVGSGIHSLSMPMEHWNRLEETGFYLF